jgi:DNA-binding IclR family transcriptional regulator
MSESEFRKLIIENLRKHPEGLTILDLAEVTRMNRATASKYVFGLVAEGAVFQRNIGTAKLCYLKMMG